MSVAALILCGAQPALAQVSRTPWQMHEGQDVIKLDAQLPPNGALAENDYIAFRQAQIPAEGAGWVTAPNPDTIGFGGPQASKIAAAGGSCRNAIDYTYFQTFVDVPPGTQVDEFKIAFQGMDDASRITIFNSQHPNGTVVEGSYVRKAAAGSPAATTDLKNLVVAGRNRVVVTQVDWCPVGNQLQSATVQLNGSNVTTPVTGTVVGPFLSVSHGDVHITTHDGLKYDFQADGEYLLIRSTDDVVVIQARQEMWKENPKVSINTAAAMNVAGDRLEYYTKPSTTLLINGVRTELPKSRLALPKGGAIFPTGESGVAQFIIEWPNESYIGRITHYANGSLTIQSKKETSRTYEGILGNSDGNPKNDLQIRGGEYLPTPLTAEKVARAGESWRLTARENLFRDGRNVGGSSAAVTEPLALSDLNPQERDAARTNCANAGISDPRALADCTYDVTVTGDAGFIESAREFQKSVAHIPMKSMIIQQPPPQATPAPSLQGGPGLLLGGEKLARGSRYAMEGHYLIFQQDGNLCVYRSQGDQFVWCMNNEPGIRYGDSASATMTAEGRLVVADANGGIVWQAPRDNPQRNTRVVLTSEGAFELRSPTGALLWSSR